MYTKNDKGGKKSKFPGVRLGSEARHSGRKEQKRNTKSTTLSSSPTGLGYTPSPRKASAKREKYTTNESVLALEQLETYHKERRDLLESVLEIYGFSEPDTRNETATDIEVKGQNIRSLFDSKERLHKLMGIINLCQQQIEHIKNIEQPIEFLQSTVRTFNVRENLPLLGKLNSKNWENFLQKEKKYVLQMESVIKCYQIPLQKRAESCQLGMVSPAHISHVFDSTPEIVDVAKDILSQLEAQNSYFPIIFGIGRIFQKFSSTLELYYGTYFDDLQQKLGLLDDYMRASAELSHFLLATQATSQLPDLGLDDLLSLPCQHIYRYETLLHDMVCDLARSSKLVLRSECTILPLANKPPPRSCNFMEELKAKKTASIDPYLSKLSPARGTIALGGMMKGMKENKGTPKGGKRKKNGDLSEIGEDEEKDEELLTPKEKDRNAHVGRRKFPLLRSTTSSIEEFTGRKRANTTKPPALEKKQVVELTPIPLSSLVPSPPPDKKTTPVKPLTARDRATSAAVQYTPPRDQLAAILVQHQSDIKVVTDANSETESLDLAPLDLTPRRRDRFYRREKSAGNTPTNMISKKNRKELSLDKLPNVKMDSKGDHSEDSKDEGKLRTSLPRKEAVEPSPRKQKVITLARSLDVLDQSKSESGTLPTCILNELRTLWKAYNTWKKINMKLESKVEASIFFYLYRNQLKDYIDLSTQRGSFLSCLGTLSISKKRLNEKEKDIITEKRHYMLFDNVLVLAIANTEIRAYKMKEMEGRGYLVKEVWMLKDLNIVTAPEPVEGDDKITFELSIEKSSSSLPQVGETQQPPPSPQPQIPPQQQQNQLGLIAGQAMLVNIISDDQFFQNLREQIDQSGTKVFGVPLIALAKRPGTKDGIPNIVLLATQWIRERCTDVEGIFRKSGALTEIEEIKAKIDQGLLTQIGDDEDEHVIANILKLYFREMPVPLIPFTHYHHFMEIATSISNDRNSHSILVLLQPHLVSLPKPHQALLVHLLKFLSDMSQFSEVTKMDCTNLAIVFSTNIIKPEEESMEASLKFNHVNNLLKLMITHVDELIELIPDIKDDKDQEGWLQELTRHVKQTPIYMDDIPLNQSSEENLPAPNYIPKPPEIELKDISSPSIVVNALVSPTVKTLKDAKHHNSSPNLSKLQPESNNYQNKQESVTERQHMASIHSTTPVKSPRKPSANSGVRSSKKASKNSNTKDE